VKFLSDPTLLRKWLVRKLVFQVAERLAFSVVTLVVGSVILAITFAMASVFSAIVVLGATAMIQHFKTGEIHAHAGVIWGISTGFMVLLFLASHHSSRDAMGYYPLRNQAAPAGGIWGALLMLLAGPDITGDLGRDLLLTGPRLVISCARNLREAVRLARMDVKTAAETLAVLARRFHRTSLSDLSKLLPGRDPMETLFKLQEMDFVLFLSREPAGVILTLEIREELDQLLGPAADREPGQTTAEEPAEPEPGPVECQEYYDLLGIEPTATMAEIKSAYRHRIKQCHPDKFAGRGEDFRRLAEERAKALNEAYEILKARHNSGR
jgi:DnaJ-domain-containing protein 1